MHQFNGELVIFYPNLNGYDVSLKDFLPYSFFSLYGPNLVAPVGTIADTELKLGTFYLTAEDGAPYVLTIVPETSSVPEPSTIALLGTGALGLFGFTTRRKVVANCASGPSL